VSRQHGPLQVELVGDGPEQAGEPVDGVRLRRQRGRRAEAGPVDRDDVEAAGGQYLGGLADPGAADDRAERVPEQQRPPGRVAPGADGERRIAEVEESKVA
jgi:hypothetical protein